MNILFKLFVSLGLLISVPASAQDGVLPLADQLSFRETMLDQPPLSRGHGLFIGATIVGLRLDGPIQKFDPNSVRVVLGESEFTNDLLCVRFISRDGRYAASARYKRDANVGTEPILETITAFTNQLTKYDTSEMAVVARAANSCDDSKNSKMFPIELGAGTSAQLVVQLEAGNARVRAQLKHDNQIVSGPDICAETGGDIRVGFTLECRLRLPADIKPGGYQLTIGETDTAGEVSVRAYALELANKNYGNHK